jgi:hypothetical protein
LAVLANPTVKRIFINAKIPRCFGYRYIRLVSQFNSRLFKFCGVGFVLFFADVRHTLSFSVFVLRVWFSVTASADNGKEFSDHETIAQELGTTVSTRTLIAFMSAA